MRVIVAGATGVIGRELLPLLTACGHHVIALARRVPRPLPDGAQAVPVDVLDAAALARAVGDARPDAVVNLLTAIPATIRPRRMAEDMAPTNLLRTQGTRNLLAATAGARVISESIAFGYRPDPGLADEQAALWPDPPRPFAPALAAVRTLEEQTVAAAGLVLRFGHLYGPGSTYAADGSVVEDVRRRRFPLVGSGGAVFSFLHAHDAATAVVAALDRPVGGLLNVVDDDPAPVAQWLPALARVLQAPPPRRVPAALARIAAGSWGLAFMTRLRGADNARAREVLDWKPRMSSWRDGFARELGDG